MDDFKIIIDTEYLAAQFKELALEVKQDLEKGIENLAAVTRGYIVMRSENELSSPTGIKYREALKMEHPGGGLHIITLDEEALWIEDGVAPGDMKPYLLKNAEIGKNGIKYKVIPFDKGQTTTKASPREMDYANIVRSAIQKESNARKRMGAEGITYRKIEKDSKGNPRLGLLHRFELGGEKPGLGNTRMLAGVSIYQTKDKKTGNVRRDILTFRTVSNGPKSAGKWITPGYKAKDYFGAACEWAEKEWESTILPDILSKWK